jgi:hypothetical protein
MPTEVRTCFSCRFEPIWHKRYPEDENNHEEGRCLFVSLAILRRIPSYARIETPYLRKVNGEVRLVQWYRPEVDLDFDQPCPAYRAKKKQKETP